MSPRKLKSRMSDTDTKHFQAHYVSGILKTDMSSQNANRAGNSTAETSNYCFQIAQRQKEGFLKRELWPSFETHKPTFPVCGS